MTMAEQTLSFDRYLDNLPLERRPEVERVWQTVRDHMPAGYTEEIGPKFLTFKAGEDWYVCLASQKNYLSLYLTPVYVFPELSTMLDDAGKNLKRGKSCINFRRAEDLPLETIAEIIGAHDAEAFSEHVQRVRAGSKKKKSGTGKAKAK
jgi:hypothetical protein